MQNVIPPHLLPMTARELQDTLRSRYRRAPESAWATHLAWTESSWQAMADPFRGTVFVSLAGRGQAFSLDDSVGGPHDETAPGELLCAALASSFDSTLRLAAARMDVAIEHLAVVVTGDVDARGALGVAGVPVGFQSMRLQVDLRLAAGTHAGTADRLLANAERHCEVLQTLRPGVPIVVIRAEER